MKKLLNYHVVTLLLVIFAAMSFSSCSDDDEDVVLESFIIGKWHSYKVTFYGYGEPETFNISKDGDWSMVYYEFDFQNDGNVIWYMWVSDDNGMSHWVKSKCMYQIIGDEVRIRDSAGGISSLSYNSKEKNLFLRHVSQYNGSQTTLFLYFRK